MDDQYLKATTEIVLKIMELGKIQYHTANNDPGKTNEYYLEELSKAFKTVYKTVTNPLDK